MKKAIIDIELGDMYKQQLGITNNQVNLLNQEITLKNTIISQYDQKDGFYEKMLKNDTLIDKQKDILITGYQKQIKTLKTKNTLIEAIGVAIIGGISYLYIVK